MDDDRTVELPRQPQLRAEHRVLDVPRRKIVVVVEADLADGSRRRSRRELLPDNGGRRVRIAGELVRLVRMHADREAHLRPQPGDALRLRSLVRVARLEDHQRPLDPSLARTRDHLVEIGRERLVGEVAVAINHGWQGSGIGD